MRQTKSRNIHLLALIVGVGLILTGAVFAIVHKQPVFAPEVRNFAQCQSLQGSVVMETSPAVCVTKDGNRYTEPAAQNDNVDYGQLDIKEWGVTVTLNDLIANASYRYDSEHDWVTLTTPSKEQALKLVGICRSGLGGPVIGRSKVGDTKPSSTSKWTENELMSQAGYYGRSGDYYYFKAPVIETLCAIQTTDQNAKALQTAKAATSELERAFTEALSNNQ